MSIVCVDAASASASAAAAAKIDNRPTDQGHANGAWVSFENYAISISSVSVPRWVWASVCSWKLISP